MRATELGDEIGKGVGGFRNGQTICAFFAKEQRSDGNYAYGRAQILPGT